MEKNEVDLQLGLRGDAKLKSISVGAENLAEATKKLMIECYDLASRIETPKQRQDMTLGYDAHMTATVQFPESEPLIFWPGIHDDGKGVMEYILEVTHGIHNHWKKSPEHPTRWGYTYNERMVDQLPFVFQRIKADWEEKKGQWGEEVGRPSGRDYQFAIWRAGEDIILEQEDPPCWQMGNIRLLLDQDNELVLNYQTFWRSRDLFKAWDENNVAQVKLMNLFRLKIQDMLEVPVKMGSYTDTSSSLHLYGMYVDRDGLDKKIKRIRNTPYQKISSSLEDFFVGTSNMDSTQLKRLIAIQSDAEKNGHGLKQDVESATELGYDVKNHEYPGDWDSWPKEWDAEPNPDKLARVVDDDYMVKRVSEMAGLPEYQHLDEIIHLGIRAKTRREK